MNIRDAVFIAEDLRSKIEPGCVPGMTQVVGSVRRKKADVHDIEVIGMPILKAPRPEFGQLMIFETLLDKLLYTLCREGWLHQLKGGPKLKQYSICLDKYNLTSLNPFCVEFYLCTPPSQWGVLELIRTGPGSQEDNFSKWCVTSRSQGGMLPDGYRVKNLAVWNVDQLDARGEPLRGETPFGMPTEESFFDFLGLKWIEPQARHARWHRVPVR